MCSKQYYDYIWVCLKMMDSIHVTLRLLNSDSRIRAFNNI